MLTILFNLIIIICTLLSMFYGIFYLYTGVHAYLKRPGCKRFLPQKRFAVLIPARNEEAVIGNLIESLKQQHYPAELYDIIVIPNNCSDNTAQVAKSCGAGILECKKAVKSKGEVLTFAFDELLGPSHPAYDAFCIFDSDNLVHPDFLARMNDALLSGAKIAQGYRDSKNPSDTWISGCHSLYYYIVNGFYDRARMNLGWSAALNGTGFVVSRELVAEHGFHTYSLTEDIEYSAIVVSRYQEKIMWVPEAVTYDEQPLCFKESWIQRRRWTAGTIQCFARYAGRLLANTVRHKSPSCFDFFVLYSAPFMQLIGLIPAVTMGISLLVQNIADDLWLIFGATTLLSLVGCYFLCALVSWLVLKLEHKDVKKHRKAIWTFGIFLASWIPIGLWSLIKPYCRWRPIKHTRSLALEELGGKPQ